jgi:Protein of unknown function (DUF2752)
LKESYRKVNFIIAGIIACIMLYSGIFSAEKANHPIGCFYTKLTGVSCPGCGLSRSFSAIIRGEFSKAKQYNANGPNVFFFFLFQFFCRLLINLILRKKNKVPTYLWIGDSVFAAILFLYCFSGFIFWVI